MITYQILYWSNSVTVNNHYQYQVQHLNFSTSLMGFVSCACDYKGTRVVCIGVLRAEKLFWNQTQNTQTMTNAALKTSCKVPEFVITTECVVLVGMKQTRWVISYFLLTFSLPVKQRE